MASTHTFVSGFVQTLVRMNMMKKEEGQAADKAFHDSAKENFVDFLLEEGLVDREDILKALSQYYQVPAFDVVGHFFEHHLLHQFPKDVMLRNAFIPIEVDENMLIVVVSEPDNPDLLAIIGESVSYDVRFDVGIRLDITDAIKEYYERALTEVEQDVDLREERRLGAQEHQQELRDQEVFYGEDEIAEGFQEVNFEDNEED
jgi:hypothetical protein